MRDAPAQRGPQAIDADFPAVTPRRRHWFRAHRARPEADGGCWFFASSLGRFDLPPPRGTCYLAATSLAAARERIARPGRLVMESEVVGVEVSEVVFEPGHVADLLHRDAALFGVTGELTVATPYRISQRWAATLDAAGFGGVRYQPRFSTERVDALAVFGTSGSEPHRGRRTSRSMRDVLLEAGHIVVGTPSMDSPGMVVRD